MEHIAHKLGEKNIAFEMPDSKDSRGILGCLRKIDDSDVVYVVDPNGYVGKSVSVDIGYAYAKKKQIYTTCPINDLQVANLISRVMTPDELIDLLKADLPGKKE
jgi:hypothetical protein